MINETDQLRSSALSVQIQEKKNENIFDGESKSGSFFLYFCF